MEINNIFDIGEMVYLKTDKQQNERIITGIQIRVDGLRYLVSYETNEFYHYDFELTKDKDKLKTLL